MYIVCSQRNKELEGMLIKAFQAKMLRQKKNETKLNIKDA